MIKSEKVETMHQISVPKGQIKSILFLFIINDKYKWNTCRILQYY